VLDAALAQIPDPYRHGHPILVRADGAGSSKALLNHVRALRNTGVDSEFSVGWTVGAREHAAIAALPESAWTAAIAAPADQGSTRSWPGEPGRAAGSSSRLRQDGGIAGRRAWR